MTSDPFRLIFVDHMAVEASRRALYRLLAEERQWEVHLVVPLTWNEGGTIIPFEPEEDSALRLHTSSVLFPYKTHRVIYLRLPYLVHKIKPDFLYMDAEPENYAALETLILRRSLAPHAILGLVSSRNIDHVKLGFPYKFSFTHRFCDYMIRWSRVDLLFCRAKVAQRFAAAYASQVCYFPHSVDCSVFTPLAKEKAPSDGSSTIGFVGRIVESKGIGVLMQAFAQLPMDCKLVLVGRGEQAEEYMKLARRLGVFDRFSIHPPVHHSEIPSVLRSFDVLVLPSLETKYWKEQFGRVLIEAMACGVPVVASNSGGIPDVVGDAGMLFKTGGASELAKILSDLVESREARDELGRKGRQRVMQFFDIHVGVRVLKENLLNFFNYRER